MKNVLLTIGCDRYSDLSPLTGAESDARGVFEVLTRDPHSYDPALSRIALSPTKAEVEKHILELAPSRGAIDVLTLYFAGHGAIVAGSYYLCLADSKGDFLSGTALSLGYWLNVVKELSPRYCYIVIDACFAGGGHLEIGNLLNDPAIGRANASTFACLAAASGDQYATETTDGGLMTQELLRVLDGRTATGVLRPELDLLDAGRVIAERMTNEPANQRPVAWGLNLFGPGRFCRNPHYSASGHSFQVPNLPVSTVLAERIRQSSDEIWNEYRMLSKDFVASRVRDLVARIVKGVPPPEVTTFVLGLADAFVARLAMFGRKWDMVEAYATFSVVLLPIIRTDATAPSAARELIERRLRLELRLISEIVTELEADRDRLVHRRRAMAEHFYLPLRLAKLLAWTAQTAWAAETFGMEAAGARELALRFANQVLEHYRGTIRAMCDQQASYLFVWFELGRRFGWATEAEQIFGAVFSDFISINGRVARGGIAPEIAFDYCLARGRDPSLIELKWMANPTELLAVLLLAASDLNLEDTVDPFLDRVDRRHFNLYFPADYRDFGKSLISEGVNRSHSIGTDVWCCADYRQLFEAELANHRGKDVMPQGEIETTLIVMASLLYPNRTALALRAP